MAKTARSEITRSAADLGAGGEVLLQQVQTTRRPVIFTQRGEGTAVLLDIESYRSLLDEIDLLRDVNRGLADVEAGRVIPHEEARQRLLARYSR